MKIGREKAQHLWDAICEYADARYATGNEGNSGEFHDDKEFRRLARVEQTAENSLVDAFIAATGWEPVLDESTREWSLR